jgi:hypothetical protein
MFNHLGHGEGFPGACDAEQNLVLLALAEAVLNGCDGGRLIAAGLIVDAEAKGHCLIVVFNSLFKEYETLLGQRMAPPHNGRSGLGPVGYPQRLRMGLSAAA